MRINHDTFNALANEADAVAHAGAKQRALVLVFLILGAAWQFDRPRHQFGLEKMETITPELRFTGKLKYSLMCSGARVSGRTRVRTSF